jgi:dTDP-4-amino-4,6-dideoxygalactose transaminase
MTLDAQDVEIARYWLARPERWRDPEPVAGYQRAFAAWHGSRFAFAFLSAREALSAVLEALELRPGDEILVPGYTCLVVPNAVRFAGLAPVFCDIELDTFGLSVADLEARISPRTRAIVVQHLYGLVCRDYEAILEFARRRSLRVVEDCAQAAGATHQRRPVGTRGDAAIFSSERSKGFCTVQGGIAVSSDAEVGERLARIVETCPEPRPERTAQLLHAVAELYELARAAAPRRRPVELPAPISDEELRGERPPGYGARMPAPLAALGLQQLAKLDVYNRERRLAALRWHRWCDEHGYRRPVIVAGSVPVFLRYPVLVEAARKRDLAWAARELGVSPGVWFRTPLHPGPERPPDCPNAELAAERCINLPCLGLPPRRFEG